MPTRVWTAFLALLVCVLTLRPRAQAASVSELLDLYRAGRFDVVEHALAATSDFDALLKNLKRDGPLWIDADPASRQRRELTAALFALEAARVDEWNEWKWIQKQPVMKGGEGSSGPGGAYQPLNVLSWKPPPLLIEWACERLRRAAIAPALDRLWHQAALAVAERSQDAQFLVGDTKRGMGVNAGEIGNDKDEIKHLAHSRDRYPTEMRFVLAEGIVREHDAPGDAKLAYEELLNDPDVGAEAATRLGGMALRAGYTDDAIKRFREAESHTRDRYVVALARFLEGQALERQTKYRDAEQAYRETVRTIPAVQSGSVALASLLFQNGRRTEAEGVIRDMLAAQPPPVDPWRTYADADDRFWPELRDRLRAQILK